MRNKETDMTYEEVLSEFRSRRRRRHEMATARWAPAGATPEEIKDAALKVLGEECAKEYEKKYG
jgi:hypothetical protein